MTQRYSALVVALERDTRDDDAESIMAAIRQLRGVLGVSGNVMDATTYTTEMRARQRIVNRVLDALAEPEDAR